MGSEWNLDDALRALARHGGQGRVRAADEIRRRGDTRRRRRHVASVAAGAVLVGVLGGGAAVIRLADAPPTVPAGPVGPTYNSATSSPSAGPTGPSAGPSRPPTGDSGPTGTAPGADPLLTGQRQVTVVRVSDWAAGISLLDDGRLAEVDGDEGRQLFVFLPQGSDTYLIRTAEPGTDDLTDTCWEVRSAGSEPLRVVAAPCAPDEPRQRFLVVRDGQHDGNPTYAISNHSAYLQHSATRGLLLEELGDAPLTTRFRLVDNGAAPE
ncbi:hypothetical protein [Micromonospora sp. WMMD1082]|uniref:hypothetical protein n=1 Tax=Micromonospora sp. WMMD1082 TaxID=3016104 RepID=UPI0024167DFB|nr:hypothetical protein [Micromonospora sp. WMMD1082]MDG4797958.1 hypothetical protein [Micromonospora sp. WMMD1082]